MSQHEIDITVSSKREDRLYFLWNKVSSMYSFAICGYKNDDKNIIYKNEEENVMIVVEKDPHIFSTIYAVRDGVQKNRYFIGFIERSNIVGMIVYFSPYDIKKCSSKSSTKKYQPVETNVLSTILYTFDFRNGSPKTYLYSQSLIFTQSHRDGHKLLLGMSLLHYDDYVIKSCDTETYINISYDDYKKDIPTHSRLIILPDKEGYTILDMGSLKYYTKNQYGSNYHILSVQSYEIDEKDSIKSFIENFKVSPEPYGDGYEVNCVKCGELTSEASWGYCYNTMNLGKSYCKTCEIRYSTSNKIWLCCKLVDDKSFCSKILNDSNEYDCDNKHSESMKVDIVSINKNSFKYPYKYKVSLTSKLLSDD